MKKLVFVLALNVALVASAAWAQDRALAVNSLDAAAIRQSAPDVQAPDIAATSQALSIDAAEPAPLGTRTNNLCSRTDPYIEYRDCVNASTRDANAKVRMG